jgi:PEP-CTERM motif
MKFLAIAALLVFAVLPAFADSFNVFAIQPGNLIPMDPGGNPLLRESFADFGFNVINFMVTLPPATTSSMAFTISLADQPLPPLEFLPYTCAPEGTSCVTGVVGIMPYMQMETNWILRVDLNGELQTFNFRYFTTTEIVKPVPEPASLLLCATGLAVIGWRRYQGHTSA